MLTKDGVGAAVIGIIAHRAYKLTKKSIGKDSLLWALYLVATAVTVVSESEKVWLFLAAGLLYWTVKAQPWASLARKASLFSIFPIAEAVPLVASERGLLLQVFLFFTKAGAFVFGSGLAIVPFLSRRK